VVARYIVAFIRRGSTRSLTNWGSRITATQASRARRKKLVDDLRDARDELELRVAKRTADLHDSNARLAEALAERNALEQERSDWLLKLINAPEDDRRRVARELHDEMGQHLCVLRIGLNELEASDPARAVRLQEQLEEIERSVRRLARDLRPAALDDLGLVTALSTYVEEWSKQTGIAADFYSRNGGQRLPTAVESTLYRIVQEALTNVARHADAQNVGVVLECASQTVIAIVEDDGRGFDPQQIWIDGSVHLGLRGIRERAALVGGAVTIESSAGTTSLFVSVPIHARERGTSIYGVAQHEPCLSAF
jgi:signal transduction histidine kinase